MMPLITLNDETSIPQLGFGTLHVPPRAQPSRQDLTEAAAIIGRALRAGYRHIDTAQMYGNEQAVGEAIAASGIARDELYVTSKLDNGHHRPDDVRRSFDASLGKLGLDYLNLFLIHWPLPGSYGGDYVSTWKAMTALVADGRLRTAGVSNFQPAHLDRIIGETGVVPAVNQIEVHPYFSNRAARAASARRGIAVEAWRPLGRGKVLDDPVIGRIAAATGKSSAQVTLRWHIQHGWITFPKSTRAERMEENIDLFDFALSAAQVASVDALDQGAAGRIGPDPDTWNGSAGEAGTLGDSA
ncbi:MAG TPA: aldo/keto reductase [Streptosporangiaceae bacterium]|nr:aldo/keto reductase [Streptosporangiaceae bacterium]